jgi:hypothetical protein
MTLWQVLAQLLHLGLCWCFVVRGQVSGTVDMAANTKRKQSLAWSKHACTVQTLTLTESSGFFIRHHGLNRSKLGFSRQETCWSIAQGVWTLVHDFNKVRQKFRQILETPMMLRSELDMTWNEKELSHRRVYGFLPGYWDRRSRASCA